MTSRTPEPGQAVPARSRRWLVVRIVAFVAVLAWVVAFVVENRDIVRTHFVFFTVETRLWVGLVVCVVAGAILGQIATAWWRRRRAQRH